MACSRSVAESAGDPPQQAARTTPPLNLSDATLGSTCSGGSPWQPRLFCDQSHIGIGFVATGEPSIRKSDALSQRDGPLQVNPTRNGPLHVIGNLEVVSGTGHTIDRVTETWLCRCGHSNNKPFCDGSHRKAGFQAEDE